MTAKLFEAALGIAPPWMVASVDRADLKAAAAWAAFCAKAGQPEAAYTSVAGSAKELRVQRKNLRRAINTLHASIRPGEHDLNALSALEYAGSMVARVSLSLETLEDSANEPKPVMNAMRNATDFKKHYEVRGQGDGNFGVADFFRGVAGMSTNMDVRNALSVGKDAAGGFTVPSRVMPEILSALVPVYSLLRAGAGIVPLDVGAKSFTTAAVNAVPSAAWRAEAAALATSDPTFRAITATTRSLAFQVKVSRELLADAENIEEALRLAIAQSFARELDRVGLLGTGAQ